MKESIGSTQLFIIVVVLVLIFAGIMSFTIKRSNAFALKDKIITTIENNDDVNDDTILKILQEVQNLSYRQIGTCENGYTGVNRSGNMGVNQSDSIFCFKKIKNSGSNDRTSGGAPQKYYYKVQVFYGLDIPIINENFTFKMESQTKAIRNGTLG